LFDVLDVSHVLRDWHGKYFRRDTASYVAMHIDLDVNRAHARTYTHTHTHTHSLNLYTYMSCDNPVGVLTRLPRGRPRN
jgi:hypothetical protein